MELEKLYVDDPRETKVRRAVYDIVTISEAARLMFCPDEKSIWERSRKRDTFVVPRQYVIYTLDIIIGHSQPTIEKALNRLYGDVAIKRVDIWHNMNKCRDILEVDKEYYEKYMAFIDRVKEEGIRINGDMSKVVSKFKKYDADEELDVEDISIEIVTAKKIAV